MEYGVPFAAKLAKQDQKLFKQYLTLLVKAAVLLGGRGFSLRRTMDVINHYNLRSLISTPDDFKPIFKAAQIIVSWEKIDDNFRKSSGEKLRQLCEYCNSAEEFLLVIKSENESLKVVKTGGKDRIAHGEFVMGDFPENVLSYEYTGKQHCSGSGCLYDVCYVTYISGKTPIVLTIHISDLQTMRNKCKQVQENIGMNLILKKEISFGRYNRIINRSI